MMLNEEEILFFQKTFTFWDELGDRNQNLLLENTAIIHYSRGKNIHSADNECILYFKFYTVTKSHIKPKFTRILGFQALPSFYSCCSKAPFGQ